MRGVKVVRETREEEIFQEIFNVAILSFAFIEFRDTISSTKLLEKYLSSLAVIMTFFDFFYAQK